MLKLSISLYAETIFECDTTTTEGEAPMLSAVDSSEESRLLFYEKHKGGKNWGKRKLTPKFSLNLFNVYIQTDTFLSFLPKPSFTV